MEDLWPTQTFCDRYEFVGNFSKGKEVANDLNIVFQYSKIKDVEIIGKVTGTTDAFRQLIRVINQPGNYLKLFSRNESIQISSEKVYLRGRIGECSSYGYIYHEADIGLEDVTITKYYESVENSGRYITFFLAGPRVAWSVYIGVEESSTGEIKNKIKNSKIELNEDFPFEIEVFPYDFYDETPAPENYKLKTNVLALHFKTEKSVEQLSNEDFVAEAEKVADDLTLLVSFLSKQWVTWYRYELYTNDSIKTYVKRTNRKCSTKELHWDDILVEREKSREFLKDGFSNLRKLRSDKFDLFMPIIYFMIANEIKYVVEQFTMLFLSLEKIKDMFALKEENSLKNLPDFKELKESISDIIDDKVGDPKVREKIQKKIPELNRPPLKFILDSLFSKYDVDWKDIYPSGTPDYTFIKTRNYLFHSSKKIDGDPLIKETYRLQVIVERLLLSILDWKDFSCSLPDYIKRLVTT
ncbi:hypothetical protein KAW50_04635 [candidate division WOR-3 bacterium]|nr:hypothetical protein [candidate division WOR-3 bacterium]